MSYSSELAEIMGIKFIKKEQHPDIKISDDSQVWLYTFRFHQLDFVILIHTTDYSIDESIDEYALKEACKEIFQRLSELIDYSKGYLN